MTVYLLFQHPLKDYTFPIRTLAEWFPQDVVKGKREAIAKLIANLMEQHNPNHSSITLPYIYFSSDDKKDKGGVCLPHIGATQESQDGPSTEDTSTKKIGENPSQNPVTGLDNNMTENIVGTEGRASEVDGFSREQKQNKLVSLPPHALLEGKSSQLDMKIHHPKDGSAVTKSLTACSKTSSSKTVPNKCASTKSINFSVAKSETISSLPESHLNPKHLSSASSTHDKTFSQKFVTTNIAQETQTQVSNMKRQVVYESDDSIFPVRGDKKKVPTKENNALQIKETRTVNEVTAHNNSGLSLLQSVYSDDSSNEGTHTNSIRTGVQFNGNNSFVKQVTAGSYGGKTSLSTDVNGMQVVYDNSIVKEKEKMPESKTKLINGTVDSSSIKGHHLMQGVPNTQTMHTSASTMVEIPKNLNSQAPSTIKMGSPPSKFSASVTTNSVQTPNNPIPSVSSTSINKSHAHSFGATQTRKVGGPVKIPFSSNVCSVNEHSLNPAKTVESPRQTAIIDRDTAEVLLIMNPTSSASNISRSSKASIGNSSAAQQNIFIDEDTNYETIVGTSGRQSVKTVSSPPLTRPVTSATHDRGGHPSSPGRRGGSEYTNPHPLPPPPLPLGSSSPTHTGSATPAGFRFSERVTSSGRTIAPPKRYLDDNEDIFSKKRREKSAQGKPRSTVR